MNVELTNRRTAHDGVIQHARPDRATYMLVLGGTSGQSTHRGDVATEGTPTQLGCLDGATDLADNTVTTSELADPGGLI